LLEINPEGSVYSILLDNNVEGRFYISYTGGLYLTEDNGKHFQKIYTGKTGKIWSDNKNPATIYFNSDQGLLRFVDTVTVGVERINNELPANFVLEQNYPNPFNPSTTIKYTLPFVEPAYRQGRRKSSFAQTTDEVSRSQSGDWLYNVTLKVYDILGREVSTLVDKEQKPGNYEVKFNANNLGSGIYFYKLKASNFVESKKMILLK